MDSQIVIVNGKPKHSFKKFGEDYVRCFVDLRVSECDRFRKKCDYLGKTDSGMMRELVLQFNLSFGCNSDNIKDPGDLFDRRAREHAKEAVKEAVRGLFPWIMNKN